MTQTDDTLVTGRTLARPVGLAALAFSVIYYVSDLVVRLGSWLDVHSVLMAVTAAMPDVVRTLSAGVRDLAFAAMGVAVLSRSRR
jgi:hypothetical protein